MLIFFYEIGLLISEFKENLLFFLLFNVNDYHFQLILINSYDDRNKGSSPKLRQFEVL